MTSNPDVYGRPLCAPFAHKVFEKEGDHSNFETEAHNVKGTECFEMEESKVSNTDPPFEGGYSTVGARNCTVPKVIDRYG